MTRQKRSPEQEEVQSVPIVRKYVRQIRAFSIGVGFGLVPFLVENPLPGYKPLIHIIPPDLKTLLLVITPLLMGSIAVVVDFYWDQKISKNKLARWFKIAWLSFAAGAILLVVIHKFFVVEAQERLFTIGWSQQPNCTCIEPDAECLEGIAYHPESCWGSPQVNTMELFFQLAYLTVNFGFGALIGLLMLNKRPVKEGPKRSPRKKPKRRTSQVTEQPTEESTEPSGAALEKKRP